MYVQAEKKHWAEKERKKTVDNQPAHYYKIPAGKNQAQRKGETSGQKSRVKTTGAKRTGSKEV